MEGVSGQSLIWGNVKWTSGCLFDYAHAHWAPSLLTHWTAFQSECVLIPGTSLGTRLLVFTSVAWRPSVTNCILVCSWQLLNQHRASLLGHCSKTWLRVSFDILTFRIWLTINFGSGFGRGHLGIVSYFGLGMQEKPSRKEEACEADSIYHGDTFPKKGKDAPGILWWPGQDLCGLWEQGWERLSAAQIPRQLRTLLSYTQGRKHGRHRHSEELCRTGSFLHGTNRLEIQVTVGLELWESGQVHRREAR